MFLNNYQFRYNIISKCLSKLGYTRTTNINDIKNGDILFVDDKDEYNEYKNVKINYIYNQDVLCDKDKLSDFLKDTDYYPEIFDGDIHSFDDNVWIAKPNNGSCGQGIIINPKNEIKNCILQKYINNPFLIDNKKFDVRILVAIKGDGTYYVNFNGIMRFCHKNYSDKFDKYSHLTNVSIQRNKYNLKLNRRFKKFQYYKLSKNKIKIIIEDIIEMFFNKYPSTKYNYGIFGFDFLIDSDLNVFLLEINSSPSFREYVNKKYSSSDITYYDEENIMEYIKFIIS